MSVSDVLKLIEEVEQKEMASHMAVEFIYKNQKYFPQNLSLGENSVIFTVTRQFYKKLSLIELRRKIKDLGTVAENASSCQLMVEGKKDVFDINSHYVTSDSLELVVSE